MRIQFVTGELAPLCQSGGLGDAVSGLARVLGARGHHVTCVVPAYREALAARGCPPLTDGGPVHVDLPSGRLVGRWLLGELFAGVSLALLDIPALYDRPGLYGDGSSLFPDNPLRFIVLSRAAAYRVEADRPDVVVAHDHHGALSLCALRTSLDRGRNRGVGAVQVVHNNAYQGRAPARDFPYTGLPAELFHPDGLELFGGLCLLKAGVGWADRVVAVSETYAQEIQDPPMGEGLDGFYQTRAHRLTGIVNGIDVLRFDPATDGDLPAHFSAEHPEGKATCRRGVLEELGLSPPPPGLFCVAIGRFATQKGWDVIAGALEGLVARGCSVALLGDGDEDIADEVRAAARAHPDRVAVRISYDGALARRLYGGADCVLIPSRFEPCGLVQLIAQRYGAVPVAHQVGGLVDTIHDPASEGEKGEEDMTGVLFAPLTEDRLITGVARVGALGENGTLPALQQRLMALDVSWKAPATRWEALLEDVCAEARARL